MARKGILIFSVLLFCILPVSSAQAGEISESGGESSVFSAIGPEALQWLADGTCSITSNMNGTIKISGKTTAYSNVDVISLTLYLQRKEGGNWVNQGSINEQKEVINKIANIHKTAFTDADLQKELEKLGFVAEKTYVKI